MKQTLSFLAALLLLIAPVPGQNPAPATAPAAAPQTEFQKWLADLDAQWQATFKREVSDACTAENDKLRAQYIAALDAGVTKASGAGDLNAAIVWRNEQKRFAEASGIPAQDDAADPPAVKQLRAAWRSQLPRIETDRATRAKALLAKYDQVLAQAQTQLTKGDRLDDALLVKARRDAIAVAWLGGIPTPAQTVPATGKVKPGPAPKPIGVAGTRRITFRATVDAGDNLVIQNGKLHIEHIDWDKPKNLSVNGMKWEPVWQGNTTDEFAKFNPPLAPFAGAHVSVHFTQKRKKDGTVKVLDQPTEANGQKLVVHLQDEGGGASDFDVHITW